MSGSPAGAQPAGFPDFGGFTAVSADNYFATAPTGFGRWVKFSTPYNIECQFNAPVGELRAGIAQSVICSGDMPGLAELPLVADTMVPGEGCEIGKVRSSDAEGMWLKRVSTVCGRQFSDGALLGVGQKVSYLNVTCAVGADQLVACLDTSLGHHGFVLRPSGSYAF